MDEETHLKRVDQQPEPEGMGTLIRAAHRYRVRTAGCLRWPGRCDHLWPGTQHFRSLYMTEGVAEAIAGMLGRQSIR